MVTAIIPCFNAAPWLRMAIESALRQSRPVAEIIVVDDGSTDASAAIASEYPVRVIATDANRGHAHARNVGLRAASHDVIAWLDADDYWDPHHCAVVVTLLDGQVAGGQAAVIAFSAVREVGARDGVWAMPAACAGPVSLLWECFEGTIVPASSAVMKRQPALEAGGFREDIRVAPDFEFWLRMAVKHPFVWTREVTSNYRRHAGQISATPLHQQLSTHRSRARLAGELLASGELDLSHRMRSRAAQLLDDELGNAWWSADMPRLREWLTFMRMHDLHTPYSRRMQRLSWMPAPGAKAWRALRTLTGGR